MNIESIKILLQNRINYLNVLRNNYELQGDIESIMKIDEQIFETSETLKKMSSINE